MRFLTSPVTQPPASVTASLGVRRVPDAWAAVHPAFAGISDIDDLLRQILDTDVARVVLPALTRLSASDGLARHALAQAIAPRLLIHLASRGWPR